MTTVLCFGNQFLKQDSLAKELADEIKLKGVDFIKCDSLDAFLESKDKNIFILDVVKGIDKVINIKDIDQLKANKLFSLHDFDLGFFLKLMKRIGKIETANIIGIPQKGDKEKIKEDIIKVIQR
ncbi:hypothetical protein CMO89_00205 [Candidatus Woesearchaeota archaeon]|nr:hypothetical protein [Candidatus Woesearchaeota archaeon]|tara:strand:- start:6301 stop:6672 length:372 start_codon:yes stop_codon:yes gene_type:complete